MRFSISRVQVLSYRVKWPEMITDLNFVSKGKVMGELILIFKWPRGFEMNFEGFYKLKKLWVENYAKEMSNKKVKFRFYSLFSVRMVYF